MGPLSVPTRPSHNSRWHTILYEHADPRRGHHPDWGHARLQLLRPQLTVVNLFDFERASFLGSTNYIH